MATKKQASFATRKKPDPPRPRVVLEIINRLLRRLKAKDTAQAARQLAQDVPYWATDDLIATLGVEVEAKQLIAILKRSMP